MTASVGLWFDERVRPHHADDDPGLPLKLWPCSNGEFVAPPLDELRAEAMRRARAAADDHARRNGWSRRRFLLSAAGMAAGLGALESAAADRSRALGIERGGSFRISDSAATDAAEATAAMRGGAVVDVQTHFLEGFSFDWAPQASCGEDDSADCFSVEYWYDLIFEQSETSVAVISAVPVVADPDPLSAVAMERGRDLATQLCGDDRVLIQGHAVPNGDGQVDAAIEAMAEIAANHELSAWKVYTHLPNGFYLDDHDPGVEPRGGRFVQAARDTGVGVIAVHKGLSGSNPFSSPVDIGPVAAANPDIKFLVYHSGFESGVAEGPYDPDGGGVDRLVRSVTEAGIGPDGNVYAELGSTWRAVMGNPDAAAHVLGKLMAVLGPERILWGTDSIWYGSPQDQIAAFRTFEISAAFQEQFGYRPLNDYAKQRIMSANAAELFGITPPATTCPDDGDTALGIRRSNRTYGPVNRR
ncbi:MAG: amidohydrolase family protein, partial [Acidimicrobiales bacterium]